MTAGVLQSLLSFFSSFSLKGALVNSLGDNTISLILTAIVPLRLVQNRHPSEGNKKTGNKIVQKFTVLVPINRTFQEQQT